MALVATTLGASGCFFFGCLSLELLEEVLEELDEDDDELLDDDDDDEAESSLAELLELSLSLSLMTKSRLDRVNNPVSSLLVSGSVSLLVRPPVSWSGQEAGIVSRRSKTCRAALCRSGMEVILRRRI